MIVESLTLGYDGFARKPKHLLMPVNYSDIEKIGATSLKVNRNSSATEMDVETGYIKTVEPNVPRIEIGGNGKKQVLTEPTSTNLITYSEDISRTEWSKINIEYASNTILNPYGKQGSYTISESANTSNHLLGSPSTIPTTLGEKYSFKFIVKKNTDDWVQVSGISSSFSTDSYANYNIGNGTIGNSNNVENAKIVHLGNGWYEISSTFTSTNTTNSGAILGLINNQNVSTRLPSYVGDGVSGVYFFGAQVEQLHYSTSYIPTNGTTVTRLQDVMTNAGDENIFRLDECGLFYELQDFGDNYHTYGLVGNSSYIQFINTNTATQLRFSVYTGSDSRYVTLSNTQFDFSFRNRIFGRYINNRVSLYVNGLFIGESDIITPPTNLKRLEISNTYSSVYANVTKIKYLSSAPTYEEMEKESAYTSYEEIVNQFELKVL